jgi:hypothetical protein
VANGKERMEKCLKDNITRISVTVMGYTAGLMAMSTKENSRKIIVTV